MGTERDWRPLTNSSSRVSLTIRARLAALIWPTAFQSFAWVGLGTANVAQSINISPPVCMLPSFYLNCHLSAGGLEYFKEDRGQGQDRLVERPHPDNRPVGIRSLPALVDLATRTNLRNDDREVVHAKKDSKIADSRRSLVVSALSGFEFRGSNGSAFSFSSFCRSRSRVGASHRSKYFSAVRDSETL